MAEKIVSTQITDHVDGQPAIVMSNGNWGVFDPKTNMYKDNGIKASPEDDATAIKYYKLGNTSTPPEAPTRAGGWDSLTTLNASLAQAGWDEDPLTTSKTNKFCWIAFYGKENVVDVSATESAGHLIFKPKYTRTKVSLWSNYADSPTIAVVGNEIQITNPDGSVVTQKFATTEAIADIANLIASLQEQMDGSVYSYSLEGEPSMTKIPVTTWIDGVDPSLIADIYSQHVGDTYTDLLTYVSYRFALIQGSASDPSNYGWKVIEDSALTNALGEIARLGREKVTIFTETPTAYSKGDMWLQPDNTMKIAIASRETFSEGDWLQPYATKSEVSDIREDLTTAQTDATAAKNQIGELVLGLTTMDGAVADAIKDSIISDTEHMNLTAELKQLNVDQESLNATVSYLLASTYLPTTPKNALVAKKELLLGANGTSGSMGAYRTAISTMIADRVITAPERTAYNNAFSTYKTHLKDFNTAISNARQAIDAELKRLADEKVDAAVIKATYWSLKASTPVTYKDSNSATASGVHTPVTVTGELRSGTTTTQGGFISTQPNGGAESTATASPRTIAPTNTEGKTSYTVRLYEKADKVTLLDTMTIPVVFKGASGINVAMSNEADVLPASPTGEVTDYADTGNVIRVFEGSNELAYTKPTTAIVKGVAVDISTKNATNDVENGNFVNGTTTGWLGTYADLLAENNSMKITSNSSTQLYSRASISLGKVNDTVFYTRAKFKVNSSGLSSIAIVARDGLSGAVKMDNKVLDPIMGETYEITGIYNTELLVSDLYHLLQFTQATGSMLGKSVNVTKIMSINVSYIFGKGNEPTKEECDKIFGGYFEGTAPLSDVALGGNGTYQVYPSPTGITEGTKSASGLACSFANASNMTTDSAKIAFNINGLSSSGTPFEFSRAQNFSKSKIGADGSDGEGGINVMITRQGSFRTYWRQIGDQGQILTAPEKVSEIIGGVEIGGIKYIQCKVIIYKGSVDVTASALADPTTQGKWYINEDPTPKATGEVFNIPISYADGKDDEVRFEYSDVNAKNWVGQ